MLYTHYGAKHQILVFLLTKETQLQLPRPPPNKVSDQINVNVEWQYQGNYSVPRLWRWCSGSAEVRTGSSIIDDRKAWPDRCLGCFLEKMVFALRGSMGDGGLSDVTRQIL